MSENPTKALTGWKINIESYTFDVLVSNTTNELSVENGGQVSEKNIIDVQEDMASMLFHLGLQQGPEDMFKAKDLANKIRAAKGYVLLDKSEKDRIMVSYGLLKGLPERYVEFLQRIRDAEEVPLKEDSPA